MCSALGGVTKSATAVPWTDRSWSWKPEGLEPEPRLPIAPSPESSAIASRTLRPPGGARSSPAGNARRKSARTCPERGGNRTRDREPDFAGAANERGIASITISAPRCPFSGGVLGNLRGHQRGKQSSPRAKDQRLRVAYCGGASAPRGWTRRGVAQLGSALRSGRRGRWFKSSRPDHSAGFGPRVPLGNSAAADPFSDDRQRCDVQSI